MKLPKFKNPLQAAADFAQRMAGEEAAPAQEKRPPKPTPPPPERTEPKATDFTVYDANGNAIPKDSVTITGKPCAPSSRICSPYFCAIGETAS